MQNHLELRDASGVSFEIKDDVQHPFFWWPRTLVEYRVRFALGVVSEDLLLIDEDTGENICFQLTDIRTEASILSEATIHFFTELPSGAKRRYRLSAMKQEAVNIHPELNVKEYEEESFIIVDGGNIKVKLPLSQNINANIAPGPIFQIDSGGKWVGNNRLHSSARVISEIQTQCLERGPLFVSYCIHYLFEDGASYRAQVRCILDYDFVELDEEMNGFAPDENIYVENVWDNFDPTHHFDTTWPDDHWEAKGQQYGQYEWRKITNRFDVPYNGEDPAFSGSSEYTKESAELQTRLAPYTPFFAYHTRPFASFWDEQSGDTLGIFINQHEKWQDQEYAIWASSMKLQVRYSYVNGKLVWTMPLTNGSRSLCLASYARTKDEQWFTQLENMGAAAQAIGLNEEISLKLTRFPSSYCAFLHNRYVVLHLNRIKNWALTYNGKMADIEFQNGLIGDLEEFEARIWGSGRTAIATKGIEVFHDRPFTFDAVEMRMMYDWAIDGYSRFYPQMNEQQKSRITALLLITAYVCSNEEVAPIRNSLGGHPNFLADLKSVPGQAAFLFPDHPMAKKWADQFEKFIELNTRFHTRPPVAEWEADGGRWTENLGIYVWAFLRPTLITEFLLQKYNDGKNRLALPQIAWLAEWLLHSLTAPMLLQPHQLKEAGTSELSGVRRRVYPPQGAHAPRRVPFRLLARLGESLKQYRPLLAEHLLWASSSKDYATESHKEQDVWTMIFDGHSELTGTRPAMSSRKFTGYGLNIRAGVHTDEEVSIHLQQIDRGPNYRWGIAGEGGCGVVYYYAQGQCYSHNGVEDVGDRRVHDTDFCSNFGVWKAGSYKSIGMNELEAPLYNLGRVQFGMITPREGEQAYSWPEYRSRSVMTLGTDYMVLHDAVGHPSVRTRFSWFVHKEEAFPLIYFAKGGSARVAAERNTTTELMTGSTKGRWYDGAGESLAVISHRTDLKISNTAFGCIVHAAEYTDYIFQSQDWFSSNDGQVEFNGKTGVIRYGSAGAIELTLIHGSRIGTKDVIVESSNTELGLSLSYYDTKRISGTCFSREGGKVTLRLRQEVLGSGKMYLNGAELAIVVEGNSMTFVLPAGKHQLEWTDGDVKPMETIIIRSVYSSEGAVIHYDKAQGANKYKVETSDDSGETWLLAGLTASDETTFQLVGLTNDRKFLVRVIACNGDQQSEPSVEYPLYISERAPMPPDGLRVIKQGSGFKVEWGQLLGVSEFRLYRKTKEELEFTEVYRGLDSNFEHSDSEVCEYRVSAVNGNGEGEWSMAVSTEPDEWLNWEPLGQDGRFKRHHTFMEAPYDDKGGFIPQYYPGERK